MTANAFTAVMSYDGADFRVRVKLDPARFLDFDSVAHIDDRGALIVIAAVPVTAANGDAGQRLAAVFALAAQAYSEAFAETDAGKAWRGEDPQLALARGVSVIDGERVREAMKRICN